MHRRWSDTDTPNCWRQTEDLPSMASLNNYKAILEETSPQLPQEQTDGPVAPIGAVDANWLGYGFLHCKILPNHKSTQSTPRGPLVRYRKFHCHKKMGTKLHTGEGCAHPHCHLGKTPKPPHRILRFPHSGKDRGETESPSQNRHMHFGDTAG